MVSPWIETPDWSAAKRRSDFPSAMLRFCACLNIDVQVCDPHHPQQNAFVERFNRSYKEECLLVDRPKTRSASAGSHYQVL